MEELEADSFGDLKTRIEELVGSGLFRKWEWRFLTEDKALWRVVIKHLYGEDGGLGSASNCFTSRGVCFDILKTVKHIESIDCSFKNSFKLKVSNGSYILFYKDPWCGVGSPLKMISPRLYALESNKDSTISDRWCWLSNSWCGNWSWRSSLHRRNLDDLASLIGMIGNLALSHDDSLNRLPISPNLLSHGVKSSLLFVLSVRMKRKALRVVLFIARCAPGLEKSLELVESFCPGVLHLIFIADVAFGESFWEEGDDFGVDVLRFHTFLTEILDFLEKFG
ncbi:hypothetical protein Tco_1578241 [Tanacetum coccineum]